MRKFFTLALMAAAVGVASMGSMGCSSGDGSGGSGGGDGGSGGSGGDGGGTTTGTATGTTTGTATGTTSTTTNTNTSADCTGLLENPNDCGLCIIDQCCVELNACANDAECADCLSNPDADPAVCDANSQLTAVNDCAGALCTDACTAGGACDAPATSPSGGSCVTIGTPAGNECNPVTNEGCDGAAGEACDASEAGFTCYPDGNVHAICEACGQNASDGQYCQGGLTCIGTCARFCCEDTDCGASGKCTKGNFADTNVGFCEPL